MMARCKSSQVLVCGRAGLLLLVINGVIAVALPSKADDILPKAPPASKYVKMAAHSPFAPPTVAVAAPAAPTPPPAPGWADNLTATMILQDGDKSMVTVVDSQSSQHLYLTAEPDQDTQMAVASVKWSDNREEAPVITLRKGVEFAQVRYESGASSPGASAMGNGGPAIPGAPRSPTPGGGAQPFHPPLANSGQVDNPGPSSAAFRRPLIRAQPGPAAVRGRPGANAPNPGARPNPAVQMDDDDDD